MSANKWHTGDIASLLKGFDGKAGAFAMGTGYHRRGDRGCGTVEMGDRAVKLVWAPFVVVMGLMAGCGVKNLPVGPTTGEVPPVVGGQMKSNRSTNTAALLRPKSLTASSRNVAISGAEVTKNQSADRGFILDPLLN